MKLEKVGLYRMTHINNIPHILQNGITHKKSRNANPNFVSIGDSSLIDTRSNKTVWVDNGDELNLNAPPIVLGDYIPFYFGVKMPMLYVIKIGGNFVEKAIPPEDIIYLVCSLNSIINSNFTYYFSDGHATDRLSTFYDSTKVHELPELIDWGSVTSAYWGGNENLNVKRKKQAEFLVLEEIAADFIVGFGCYNDTARQRLIAMGVEDLKIKVIPQAYY